LRLTSLVRFGWCGLLAICSLPCLGAVVYNEVNNGDFSGDGLNPTSVTVNPGSNQIFGSTGRGTAIDRDYFKFTVPTGYEITALSVLPGTTVGGAVSFIGLQAGPQVTVATNAATAAGLLGWWHYSSTDTNILTNMAVPSNGSSGFSRLGAGTYSIWIQDFNAGTFNYGFDIAITATPEPAYTTLVGFVALMSGIAARRRQKK
jgi:hypothetical protein